MSHAGFSGWWAVQCSRLSERDSSNCVESEEDKRYNKKVWIIGGSLMLVCIVVMSALVIVAHGNHPWFWQK